MFVPSSTSRHWFLTLLFSVASLVAVHAAVIVAHEKIDEAHPDDRWLYSMDRLLEKAEWHLAKVRGDEALLEHYVHIASERLEELEHDAAGGIPNARLELMAVSAEVQTLLYAAQASLESLAAAHPDDTATFRHALLLESASHTGRQRLQTLAQSLLDQSVANQLSAQFGSLDGVAEYGSSLIAKFDVEPDVANTLQAAAEKEVLPASLLSVPDANTGSSCVPTGGSCTTSTDCCEAGSSCIFAFTASGRERRCLNTR